jgi:hypothetical protein
LPSVKIIRPYHPLNGKELKVFAQAHRNGVSYLIVVLPDDSHAYIPVAWTDLQGEHDPHKSNPTAAPIAFCRDLMRTQVVVDSLLRRISSVKTATKTQKENGNGTNDIVGTKGGDRIGYQSNLAATRSRCKSRYGHKAFAINGQSSKPKSLRNAK